MTLENVSFKNIFIVLDEEIALISQAGPWQFLSKEAAANLDLQGSLTVYPVLSRTLLVKMALGISDSFPSHWFVQCLATGSSVEVMLSGCTKFTGAEPQAYIDMIMDYYRRLVSYGVVFRTVQTSSNKEECRADSCCQVKEIIGKVITQQDLASIYPCKWIKLEKNSIVTASGQEFAKKNNIVLEKVLEGR